MNRRRFAFACIFALAFIGGIGMAPALAQDALSPYLNDNTTPFTMRHLRAGRSTLQLTDEQWAQASALWEGMNADLTRARIKERRQTERAGEEVGANTITQEQYAARIKEAHATFLTRRQALEESLLSDLRSLLSDAQADSWQTFLRDRRIDAIRDSAFVAWPSVSEVLEAFQLTPAETAAIAEPLAQHLADLDPAAKAFFSIRRALIDYHREHPEDQNEPLTVKLKAASSTIRECLQRGIRSISEQLAPERASQLRALYDETETRRLVHWTSTEKEQPIRDFLNISTLTKAQRAQLRDLAASIDHQGLKAYAKYAESARNQMLGLPANDQDVESKYDKVNKEIADILKDVRKHAMEILSPAQMHAYEEGMEPPPRRETAATPQARDGHDEAGVFAQGDEFSDENFQN